MTQKWHYVAMDQNKNFINNTIDSELTASQICNNLESFGWEVVLLEKVKKISIYNFLYPIKYFYEKQALALA